jgi:hypothetical protein
MSGRLNFQQLASAVHLDTDPLKFSPTSISSTSDTVRPSPQTHPKVRFWNKSDFVKWLDSPEADHTNRGKLPFLEDENGNPISGVMVEPIRKALRAAWSELASRDLAPPSWGKLTASGVQLMNSIMENAYPLFKLANNGWKLDYLATSSYSSWHRNHFDALGDYRKVKKEDGNTETDRQKRKPLASSEVPKKRIKGVSWFRSHQHH